MGGGRGAHLEGHVVVGRPARERCEGKWLEWARALSVEPGEMYRKRRAKRGREEGGGEAEVKATAS